MKYVLFYDPAEDPAADVAGLARQHFPDHRARWSQFRDRGTLLLIGPFSDGSGAMAVFTTREAAEEFARDDPFVVHGVVGGWSVREWNEALLNPGAEPGGLDPRG
jgi:uncharacterized protein